ncbi:O-antigen ligase family protein [Thermaerobacter litoralis]
MAQHYVSWPAAFFVWLPFLTVAWSVDPALTARKALVAFVTYLCAVWVVRHRTVLTFKMSLAATTVIMFLSIIIVAAAPEYGLSQSIHYGSWRGVFLHKNALGSFAVLHMTLVIAGTVTRTVRPTLSAMLLMLGVVNVLGSDSKTALVLSVLLLVLLCLLALVRRRYAATLFAYLVMLSALASSSWVIWVATYFDTDLDLTMTGRVPLWSSSIRILLGTRPFLGFGYEAFWTSFALETGERLLPWIPSQGHNGYIDIFLAYGLGVGTIVLGFLIMTFIKTTRRLMAGLISGDVWSVSDFLVTTVFLVHNMTENIISVSWSIWTLMILAVCLSVWNISPKEKNTAATQDRITITRTGSFLTSVKGAPGPVRMSNLFGCGDPTARIQDSIAFGVRCVRHPTRSGDR